MNFLVDALATYRIVRLIHSDGITRRPRDAMFTWAERPIDGRMAHPMIVEWMSCDWCISMWVAGGVVLARKRCPLLWEPVGMALALSAGAGGISTLLREVEGD